MACAACLAAAARAHLSAPAISATPPAAALAACVAPPPGLVAWYPGDGLPNDTIGAYHGTFGPSFTFAEGRVGQAFFFDGGVNDGQGDIVRVPHSPSLNPPASFTLDAWIFVPDDLSPGGAIISKWGDSGAYANQRAYLLSYEGGGRIRFGVSDDARQNDSSFHAFNTPPGVVPFNTWTHVAAVYEQVQTGAGTRTIYINGAQVAQRTDTISAITNSTADLSLGARLFSPDLPLGFFRGRIDEAEILTRALSQAEIQAIVAAGAEGKCKNTLLVVSNTDDSGPGSLRQAILTSNSMAGTQTITFNIPGSGVRMIAPTSALPTITAPVVIDGYTQPGSSPNTLAVGNNAVFRVSLRGINAGVGPNGLHITGGDSTVRGLTINSFSGDRFDRGNGIYLQSNNNRVEGCFIGTGIGGNQDFGNTASGIFISDASGNVIGGPTHAARNLISGNNNNGIDLVNSSGNTIVNNYLGTNSAGTAAVGNTFRGVLLNISPNNTVGGTAPLTGNLISGNGHEGVYVRGPASTGGNNVVGNLIGTNAAGGAALGNVSHGIHVEPSNNTISANRVAFNGGDGIFVAAGAGNRLSSNSIFSNSALGIDLGADGVTPNDAGDGDAGPNDTQNFPVLSSATAGGVGATITGTLDSRANATYSVLYYASPSCDPSGSGEGQTVVGSANVSTNAAGTANISAGPFVGVAAGQVITATATHAASGNTSEFSPCVPVTTPTLVTVTNTSDDGVGSLRRAVADIGDGGVIEFGPEVRGAINLTGEIVVNKRVTITGPGANLLKISGNSERRILRVEPGGSADITGLTFERGTAASGGLRGDGGALLNEGTLTLTNCSVLSSIAGRGGGVFNRGSLTVKESSIFGNAGFQGGGIYNVGTATVTDSTIWGNFGESGGGLHNAGSGDLTLTNSTLSNNRASVRGAGLAVEGGQVRVVAATIARNLLSAGRGGGLANTSGAPALRLRSSIVGENISPAGPDDIFGPVTSEDFNLISQVGGANVVGATAHNVVGQSPRVGPLQNNGGPTNTHALLPGSPALDRGGNALALTTDQRGRPRLVDGDGRDGAAADIGAFESGFSISGRVFDSEIGNLAGITLVLNGPTEGRRAISTAGRSTTDNNFTIMDVRPGAGYTLTAHPPPQLVEDFLYRFDPLCLDVSAAGGVSARTCDTQEPRTELSLRGTKQRKRFATITGRVTDGEGISVGGVTLTLSGQTTVVRSLPACDGRNTDCGLFSFTGVPTGADYTLTPTRGTVRFTAAPFDNGRGGADLDNLGAGLEGGETVTVTVDFFGDFGAAPVPMPTPSDDFTAPTPDPNRFKGGVLSLDPTSVHQSVNVVQGNGQLQITPPTDAAAFTGGARPEAQAAVDIERFNGYVTVRDIDLNTSTTVTVSADEPLEAAGAHTVFSVGSDGKNFYRIRVGDAARPPRPPTPAAGREQEVASAASHNGTMIFFEAFSDDPRDPPASSSDAVFDKNLYAHWRLRLRPRTNSSPGACAGIDAPSFILYETSADRRVWTTRFCAPARGAGGGTGVHSATELGAGTVGPVTQPPGTARFSDYRVADQTGIHFDPENPASVKKSLDQITLRFRRTGDLTSAAAVDLDVEVASGSEGTAALGAASTHPVYFEEGQSEASVTFDNPIPNEPLGERRLALRLSRARGAALPTDAAESSLVVEDEVPGGEPIDGALFFTSQQYCDFLNRPPDNPGLGFWSRGIVNCGGDEDCRRRERVNVSAAFFLSIEFQETGFFVYRLFHTSFKRMPLRSEFLPDVLAVREGITVGEGEWERRLRENKQAFLDGWMQRPAFREKFDRLNSVDFVREVYAGAGVPLTDAQQTALSLQLLTGQKTRRDLFVELVESPECSAANFNSAFVLMQYFGYLQRDPDEAGFQFWLKKLNDFHGDWRRAEMVRAFVESIEYRERFRGRPSPTCAALP